MQGYTIRDLERWDESIRAQAEAFGLNCRPQEFELCDHFQMLSYMAYSGMPAHYPHWSYGKAYEKVKSLYDHGVSGLPYEMVINSSPSVAYLMRDNSLALQVLTIAHVYGHNDFFGNNHYFQRCTRADLTLGTFKLHADRVRAYAEDPSIGLDRVEAILDAAHALSLQLNRNPAMRRPGRDEQERAVIERAQPPPDPFHRIHRRAETGAEPNLHRIPLEPTGDLLLFLRDHNPRLASWERDLLTMVHEEAQYFLPQIETKIMNEGWASFWHHRILGSLDLPAELQIEFLVHHHQVVRPHPGGINPYHIGFRIWEDLLARQRGTADAAAAPQPAELAPLFASREADRDSSFLRRFLHADLMRDLGLFEYRTEGEDRVVSRVADADDWEQVRDTLIANTGMGSVPVVEVLDADLDHDRTLHLRHRHDGRDLQLEYAEKTLAHVYALWGRRVLLETELSGGAAVLAFGADGFEARTVGGGPDE